MMRGCSTGLIRVIWRLTLVLSLTCPSAQSRVLKAQQAPQTTSGQTTGNQSAGNQGTPVERPHLLFLLQHPAAVASGGKPGTQAQRDDPATQLSVTLREALTNSRRYDIILYGPEQPSIKRALLEHTIAVSDMVEPIRPDALQRLAHAIGARYAFTLRPTFDKQGIKVELRYDENVDGENWRIGFAEQISYEVGSGKRHLKTSDLIALAVDDICSRLGVPSHLAARINLGQAQVAPLAPTIAPEPRVAKQTDKPTRGAQNTPGLGTGSSGTGSSGTSGGNIAAGNVTPQPADIPPGQTLGGTHPVGKGTKSATQATNGDAQSGNSANTLTDPTADTTTTSSTPASSGGSKRSVKAGQNPRSQRNNQVGPVTAPPVVALPPPARPDYVTLAERDRQAGDLSSAITMLRRAVNVSPRDPALRRQLIRVYAERHMTEAALAEAERALQLMPADNTLKRLHGDALLARGDTPGALKVYREIVQADPTDVAAQVALADALLADNQYNDALTAYETAAKNDPNSPLPHRRLARVYAARAAADPAQYKLSLEQLTLARQLTSSSDADTYREDYIALMRQMDQRMRDMADEIQHSYQAAVQGKNQITEVTRAMGDLKERAVALGSYLDDVPPAVGQVGTHLHYAQGCALLIQSIDTFRRVLGGTSVRLEEAQTALRVARADTLHELTTAGKMLLAVQSDPRSEGQPDSGVNNRTVPATMP